MFHYRDGATTHGLKNNGPGMILAIVERTTTRSSSYILDCLHKVQNMQDYACHPDCYIDEYVSHSKKLED
jgi:hypothetical protein